MSAVFDPTAASALSPANRPTTTISAALNSNCKMLEHINGSAKRSILPNTESLHISISYFLFMRTPPLFINSCFRLPHFDNRAFERHDNQRNNHQKPYDWLCPDDSPVAKQPHKHKCEHQFSDKLNKAG